MYFDRVTEERGTTWTLNILVDVLTWGTLCEQNNMTGLHWGDGRGKASAIAPSARCVLDVMSPFLRMASSFSNSH